MSLSGGRVRGVVILQSLLLWASIGISCLLLSRRRGRAAGLVFWFAAILFLRIRDASSAVMSEPLSAALFLPLGVLLLDPPARPKAFLPIGLLLGALFLVRPNLGGAALLLLGVSCALRGRWSGLAAAAIVMAVVVAPFWIATSPGPSGDRARGLTYQLFEGSADDYWFPSIAPAPDRGTPAEISRDLRDRALENWRRTLARSGGDARRQIVWRALHGLLGTEFYDARWSGAYRRMSAASRALSPFGLIAAIALLLAPGLEDRTLAACGLLLVAILVAQDLALGSNPRYALPCLPVLLLFGVCAAVTRTRAGAAAALVLFALLLFAVFFQKSVLGVEWGTVEAAGVSIEQPISRGALPGKAPATLHIRIATPLLPTQAGLEVRDSRGRLLYSSGEDAGRQRPEITIPLPQDLLAENRRAPLTLRLTAIGSYDGIHYLLFPVIPRPWAAPARRERSPELSPGTGIVAGSLDWWAHAGSDPDERAR